VNPYGRTYRRAFVMTGDDAAGWAQAMSAEIHRGLQQIGIVATLLRPEEFRDAFAKPIGERYVMIDLNHKLRVPPGVRTFSVMVDHPCDRIGDLAEDHPPSSILGWVDRSHLPAAATLRLPYRSLFLPHAGPTPSECTLPSTKRPVDVFFAGILGERWERGEWAAAHAWVPPLIVDIIFDAVDRLAFKIDPVLPIFIEVCRGRGIDPQQAFTRDVLCAIVANICKIAEVNRRVAVLAALPDIEIAVASNYLPVSLRGRRNVRYLGYIQNFDEIRREMGRAKIVLNATSKFPAGSHERIWYGIAEGAVLLTDPSTYLDEQFEQGREMLYLPPGDIRSGDLDYLADLVRDRHRLDDIANRAAAIYRRDHTWTRRAAWIDEAINGQVGAATGSAD